MPSEYGVAVIGSITIDVSVKAPRLPRRGQTVVGSDFRLISGGKGSNQAVMSAHMGSPTWMVGCVGNDVLNGLVLGSLQQNAVNTKFVSILEGESTGIAHIRIDEGGDNDIVIVPLANSKTNQVHVDAFFSDVIDLNVLLLQLEIPVPTVYYAAKRAKEKGIRVIFDPAPAISFTDQIYQYIDIITPNETEASVLTGIEVTDVATAKEAAEVFHNKGVSTTVITLGDKGVVTLNNDGFHHYEAYPVDAIDTTAAGDAFTGTLGACLSQGRDFDNSIVYAMAAGALTVTQMGAQPSLPTKEAIRNFLMERRIK
ncbi:ribokinase [Alicyclobacillus tolerans]|uniref:ribokinase n=1 Tax=Alicyclobacillus tolerans TaxID=90970 RepID=UPI001F0289DA|nr:ribokinase [Alicyclobacillus tolerans]MCF8567347.1 ribokinase [Alicyclobacillus tolerans]